MYLALQTKQLSYVLHKVFHILELQQLLAHCILLSFTSKAITPLIIFVSQHAHHNHTKFSIAIILK
jgi:hypothetical protein